jgi:hypothetical protein
MPTIHPAERAWNAGLRGVSSYKRSLALSAGSREF